ncbi:regulator of chromosome condensation 1/beta-lactamase-inhibitor protein II, partial [Baffinella frigidus]
DVGERVIKVAAGGGHSLVLTYDDVWDRTRVWAFGDNSFGQLGSSGFAASNPVPVLVGAAGNFDPLKAEDVYAGGFHSAVVDSSKRAWLFGHNAHSQLGFTCAGTCVDACPSTPDSPCLTQPVPTRLPSSVPTGSWLNVSMALGLHHSLLLQPALDGNSSRFFSFGRNTYGQLARGDASVVGEPRTASNTTFLALCAGADHTMLLDADG